MNVMVNGQQRTVSRAQNISEFVNEMQLVPATLLIEHNGVALHRHEWDGRSLREGDRIELVRVVAGG